MLHSIANHLGLSNTRCSRLRECGGSSPRSQQPRRNSLSHVCSAAAVDVVQATQAPQEMVRAPSTSAQVMPTPPKLTPRYESDARTGLQRLKFDRKGWDFWNWTDGVSGQTHRVHYVQAGDQGPAVVLVHGYGASAYHWRYTIPALAQNYRVFAVDMLGFGWSDKAIVDYSSGGVWSRQLSAFISQVVGGGPAVLVGNSLGGFASMATAASSPDLVRAVAVLNGAGPFEDATTVTKVVLEETTKPQQLQLWLDTVTTAVSSAMRRGVMQVAFLQAKQPERIRQVLELVYTHREQLDKDLVESIEQPARDPKASEVFYLVNSQRGNSPITVNSVLKKMGSVNMPLLLLWGDLDPWMGPSRAAKIQQLYPAAEKVSLQSGHCPHDDSPVEANAALLDWLQRLPDINQA